jgi:hypothetical protein
MRTQQSEDALPNIRVRLLQKLIFRYEVTESNGRSNLLRRISLLLFPTSSIPLAILLIAMSTYEGRSVRTAPRVHTKLCCEQNPTPLFPWCISFGLCCYYWANMVGKFGVFAIAFYPMETQMFDAAKQPPHATRLKPPEY